MKGAGDRREGMGEGNERREDVRGRKTLDVKSLYFSRLPSPF